MLDIIKRAVTGVGAPRREGRPRGVAFLAGPTGVGKTELTKTMTRLLFGDESAYIRFDMSEFSAEHSDQRLIGAPPGYIGYGHINTLAGILSEMAAVYREARLGTTPLERATKLVFILSTMRGRRRWSLSAWRRVWPVSNRRMDIMVTKAQISRLLGRIDAVIAARKPPGGREVVIMSPFKEDDDAAVARHCAAHPEDRGADRYILITVFALDDCDDDAAGGERSIGGQRVHTLPGGASCFRVPGG